MDEVISTVESTVEGAILTDGCPCNGTTCSFSHAQNSTVDEGFSVRPSSFNKFARVNALVLES